MGLRLEFLAYFVVLLAGVSIYLTERPVSWPIFLVVVAGHLVVLRFLCGRLARRFKFADERKKAA